MTKKYGLLVLGLSLILSGRGYSQTEPAPALSELTEQADAVLNLSNVSARKEISIVFELADRLLAEKQIEDAEKYLSLGLEHYPWDLAHQMVYAKLLAANGRNELAKEKADFVFRYAETEELIEQARQLLGNPKLTAFPDIYPLPGTNHCVVLIPLQECNPWVVTRISEGLSRTLDIPVFIQRIEAEYPPFSRDQRKQILRQLRKQLTKNSDDPQLHAAMSKLELTGDDLNDEDNVIAVMKQLLASSGPEAVEQFETSLSDAEGKNPQWNADGLKKTLNSSVKSYRRENVAYLGITSEDIYANNYNFLFGWTSPSGGIMSYHRFTSDFNDDLPNQDRLIKRSVMQGLSSVGLIYGVKRCTNPTCAKAYPNSLSEHDAKEGTLCSECKKGFKNIFEPVK